jgi:hypothetical protein
VRNTEERNRMKEKKTRENAGNKEIGVKVKTKFKRGTPNKRWFKNKW